MALTAPYVLEYTYRRSVGPVVGQFLTGLRDQKFLGMKTSSGRILVPPPENDPETGETLSEMVAVGDAGVVTTWSWVSAPRKNHPLQKPFAWALVKLDGADTAMLHVVDVGEGGMEKMSTGMRVRARWKAERIGHVTDVACFEPESPQAVTR